MADEEVTYTIAAPVYNEIDSLPELCRRLTDVMDGLGEPWELILVDDGSSDGSREWIEARAAADPHLRPVIFARNFGHQIGITAGLDFSRGKAVVVMDADLQDPPEVVPQLIEHWKQGYEANAKGKPGSNALRLHSSTG